MFSAAFLVQALLATAAFAIPSSKERLAARRAHRSIGAARQISNPASLIANTGRTNTSHVEYFDNWSGGILVANTATYQAVTGTFTVPTPKSTGGSGEQCATAWVGIDGDTCQTAILQTGLDFCVQGTEVDFWAWYEFWPAFQIDFTGISFAAGDSVTATATVISPTEGTLTIENISSGVIVSQTVSSSSELCQTNAEWIVEDFEECDGDDCELVPFANFGTVVFTDAEAATASGTVTAADAQVADMQQNGEIVASASVSGSTVTVEYTG